MTALLYSLAEFSELILQVLRIVDARRVVEIGAGEFSGVLREWAALQGAEVDSIDPQPPRQPDESRAYHPIRGRSLEVLRTLAPADAYLIDGDHNYHTAYGELELIHQRLGERQAVIFEHDIGWPCGRRDLYYKGGEVPLHARHQHSFERGAVLDSPQLACGGFRGEGEFALAQQEGGPRNGVLTAIEDFLALHPALELFKIPAIFGLGVIVPAPAPWANEVRRLLEPLHENPLLARLERNRLELYLQVLELQDRLRA